MFADAQIFYEGEKPDSKRIRRILSSVNIMPANLELEAITEENGAGFSSFNKLTQSSENEEFNVYSITFNGDEMHMSKGINHSNLPGIYFIRGKKHYYVVGYEKLSFREWLRKKLKR